MINLVMKNIIVVKNVILNFLHKLHVYVYF